MNIIFDSVLIHIFTCWPFDHPSHSVLFHQFSFIGPFVILRKKTYCYLASSAYLMFSIGFISRLSPVKWNDIIITLVGLAFACRYDEQHLLYIWPAGKESRINRWRDHYCDYHIYYSVVDTQIIIFHWCSFGFEHCSVRSTTQFIELKRNENWFRSVSNRLCVFDLPSLALYKLCHRQFDFN